MEHKHYLAAMVGKAAAQMAMINQGECADLFAKVAAHHGLETMYEHFCLESPIRQIEGGYTFDANESLFGPIPMLLEQAQLTHRAMWERLWNETGRSEFSDEQN